MMTKEEVLAAWAPDDVPWSPWVKPVLFAHLELARSVNLHASLPTSLPQPAAKVVLVVDLPGLEGVATGIALAKIGYRPIPLYNALPLPMPIDSSNSGSADPWPAIDIVPIISALQAGAEILASLRIPADAPPAFLLDAHRRGDWPQITPGQFDNRSISFPTDFPSAEFLNSHGIKSVLSIHQHRLIPQPDLEPTLRRWKDGNIPIERLLFEPNARPEPLVLKPPPWYRSLISSIFSWAEPRPNDGSFGHWTSAGG